MSDRPLLAPNVKPPLSAGLKASATIAGVIGYLFITVGWALMVVAIAVGSAATTIATAASQQAADAEGRVVSAFLRTVAHAIDVGAIPLVITAILGAILLLLGLVISRGILRRAGHFRPWGVTWAGLGIAVLFGLLVTAIAAVVAGILTPILLSNAARDVARGQGVLVAFSPLRTEAIVFGIVFLVLTLVVGWLSWSLMARALRPTAQQLADREARRSEHAARTAHRQRIEAEAAARGVRPSTVEKEEREGDQRPASEPPIPPTEK